MSLKEQKQAKKNQQIKKDLTLNSDKLLTKFRKDLELDSEHYPSDISSDSEVMA